MTERLAPRDVALLASETASVLRHNATVEILDPTGSGFDYDELVRLVEDRLSFVPRYRQRVQSVPGRLANPVWVDDARFDLGYHVRRSALPRPGSMDQLLELVARIVSRPLDRHRPLWEVYLVEGLADGRVALLSKTHQALVDGIDTVDLGQLLLDHEPRPRTLGGDGWTARRRPGAAGLVAGAVRDSLAHPGVAVDTVRTAAGSTLRGAGEARRRTGQVVNALLGRRPVSDSPLTGALSEQRRVVVLDADLEAFRRIRDAHGGSVNDVVLATVAGGLRTWLMARGSTSALREVRVAVPVSVIDAELEATSLGSEVTAHYVDLPLGEPSPVVRLHQVSYSFEKHKESGKAIAANRLAGIAGFAPTTFHAIGSRLAAAELGGGFTFSVTNVPGPQAPLYAAGARMLATYPVHPLLPGQALSIGVTSYDGQVFFGLTADRDLLPDADLLGQCLREALDELLDTASGTRRVARRGRRKAPAKAPAPTPST